MHDPVALISTEIPIMRYYKHNIYYVEYSDGQHEYSCFVGDKEYKTDLIYKLIRIINKGCD